MKKILIATTALVATAGMAAADITFGGYGRFGVTYADDDALENKTSLEQRFRLTATATAETDSGIKVEGRIRLQADDNAGDNTASGEGPGAAGFAVSTGGFRLDVGHVSDVLDSGDVLDYYGNGVGLTYFLEAPENFAGFDANGFGNDSDIQQKVKVRYSAGAFTVAASYAPKVTVAIGTPDEEVLGEYWQIGAGYSFDAVNVGAVYGDKDGLGDYWVLGADGAVGDFGYSAMVGDSDGQEDVSWGLTGAYAVSSATTITAVVTGGGATDAETAYGVGFAHSLGGGVSLRGGVGSDSAEVTKADFGVVFNF